MNDQPPIEFPIMSRDERSVWAALQNHIGKGRAINQRHLAEASGLAERAVRSCITRLIVFHGKRICSNYNSDGGYFLPANDQEVEETCRVLHGHALKILRRYSVLKKMNLADLLKEIQRELPFEFQSPN